MKITFCTRLLVVPLAMMAVIVMSGFDQCTLAEEPLEYNRDIRPILADNCFACHGADSAAREADLRIDQREAVIEFGALVPGQPDESELLLRVLTDDPDLLMPPPETKKTLTAAQKEILKRWIAAGAEYQPHWSFILPSSSDLPVVENEAWVKNAIDRYVLAKLQQHGLSPAPEADARTLFRRLHLDITGLPPSPQDVAAFVSDYRQHADNALSDWIDRLMNSSAWGEHRARYWLDAARYGDTHGLHFDNYREMWPYRDWVIRAFNANQPFHKFTVEQIAGDLLTNPTDDQLIATGFQRCNITTNEGGTIDEENLANYAVDRVQTFGWVYLGLTTNCGQCHDHKFDPFTMKDYYSLAAFFRNTTQGPKDGNVKDGRGPFLVIPSAEDRPRWEALPGEIAAAKTSREEQKKTARSESKQWVASVTAESLDEDLLSDALIVHVPMNEGTGTVCLADIPSLTVPIASGAIATEQSSATESAATEAALNQQSSDQRASNEPTAEAGPGSDKGESDGASETPPLQAAEPQFQATGEIAWGKDGKNGPAPVIKTGSTFDLGGLGDFEKDQSFSYGAWVKPANNRTMASILARMDVRAAHRGWDLWQNGRSFSVHIVDAWPGNSLKVTTQKPVVKPGKWQHVFATYDGSGKPAGIKIYLDGKEQPIKVDNKTLQPDASIRTPTPLRIGQRSEAAVFDGGSIQDVRIFARKLAPAEVQAVADNATLQMILATEAENRTPQQQQAIFDYYLVTQDEQYPALAEAVTDLEAELEAIRSRSPVTHIQEEKKDSQAMTNILIRGEYDRKGDQVEAATPAALHPLPPDAPKNRLGLANWLVDSANPLTARVTVNRFWQQVFGQGIVATAEDFGVMGALPTHPELLDWLAIEFQETGWDVKQFFKLMLMSAAYRQSSMVTAEKLEQDRDNVLLSRGPRFRMDAEMVRDCALASSGLLSSKMYGPGVKPYQPEGIWDIVGLPGGDTRNYEQGKDEDLHRGTVYTFWKRMAPPPSLEAFNAPSREVCTVRRERTNTPLQALVTLNDPQFVEAARRLAAQALASAGGDDAKALDSIAQRVLGRPMKQHEQTVLLADKQEFLAYYQSNPEDAKALISVGASREDESLDPSQLAAWTMVCNQVMNLDEALNK